MKTLYHLRECVYRKGTKQGFKRFYNERKTTNRRNQRLLILRVLKISQSKCIASVTMRVFRAKNSRKENQYQVCLLACTLRFVKGAAYS